MITGGRPRREGELGGSRTHESGQLFVDDLDELLRGRQALQDLAAQGALLDPFDELLDHLEIDVGFEQRETDLAGGPLHVFVREFALPLEAVERCLQLVRKGVEHLSPCHPAALCGHRDWSDHTRAAREGVY